MASISNQGPTPYKPPVAPVPAAPPPPPTWLTPSTTTTTYGATGASGSQPQYQNGMPVIPPPPGGYIDPAAELAKLQAMLPPPPTIVAPQVQAAQIQVPGGSYEAYQQALYESQFAPVERELSRQMANADQQVSAMMAQAGLADSGTGVGQRMDTMREYDQRIEDASRDISAAATASTEAARFNILTANAQLQQQASLANAGFDYQAQVANAQNILNGNTALAQGYLTALGISSQQATDWSKAYLSYFSEAERNKILKDQALQQFHGEWLNYLVQKEKIANDYDINQQQVGIQQGQLTLQQSELKQQEELERLRREQEQRQFDETYKLQQEELRIAGMQANQPAQPDRRLMYDGAGVSDLNVSTNTAPLTVIQAGYGYPSPYGF